MMVAKEGGGGEVGIKKTIYKTLSFWAMIYIQNLH